MLCGEKHFGQGSQIVFNFGVRQKSRQDTHIHARHVAHAFCKGCPKSKIFSAMPLHPLSSKILVLVCILRGLLPLTEIVDYKQFKVSWLYTEAIKNIKLMTLNIT